MPRQVCVLASLGILLVAFGFNHNALAVHYEVFILAGQSNMVGQGATNELPPELQDPQSDVLLYEGSTLQDLQPSGSDFGPEITFGRTIADAFPAKNFALIKYAVGGTDLHTDWDPSPPDIGPQYSTLQSRISNGLAALQSGGNTTEIVGMLWTQGERDAREMRTSTQYEGDLNEFIGEIRDSYGADLPFFLSRLSINQTDLPQDDLNAIRAAQTGVADADPLAYIIDTDSFGLKSDDLHFDAAGQISLGEAFGQAYIASIPEPSALVLAAVGLTALCGLVRRKRDKSDAIGRR